MSALAVEPDPAAQLTVATDGLSVALSRFLWCPQLNAGTLDGPETARLAEPQRHM